MFSIVSMCQPAEKRLRFQSSHNLSNDHTLWAYQTCSRLRFKNKKYRGKTKQALVDQALELQILHTEFGMRLNAYKHITTLVDLALSECRAAYHYHDRVRHVGYAADASEYLPPTCSVSNITTGIPKTVPYCPRSARPLVVPYCEHRRPSHSCTLRNKISGLRTPPGSLASPFCPHR